jgi:precorrin-2 methylase
VEDWRRRRAGLYEDAIAQLGEDECGAFLVWGDPGLYDGTIEILDAVRRRGAVDFVCQVIPGISSIQALAARHGISLSRSGRPLHITTGRRLADGLPAGADDVVVMLDANCAFREAAEPGTRIYWGAYVGTPYELLAEGDLPDAGPDIEAARDRARSERGWMMDSYLLRRNPRDPEPDREAAASDEAPAADPVVVLSPWSGPWPDGDPDANFKADVALYSNADPLDTLRTLSANTGIPLGALVRYVLARWASAGSESLLYAGPSVVERMWGEFRKADEEDSDEARRRAYEAVRQMVAWLRLPLS